MRIRLLVGASALLMASAITVRAQETGTTPLSRLGTGWFDVGFRAMTVDGDEARFQKYRDLRDGPTLDRLRWDVERNLWLFTAEADHTGYRDQHYSAEYQRLGKVKASFDWLQVPVFLSTDTRSLYATGGNGVFRIDDAIRQGVQNGLFSLNSQAGRATGFDLRWRDDFARFDVVFTPVKELDLKFSGTNKNRSGQTIFAGNFGFTNAIELAAPLDDRTTDFNLSADWANDRGQFNVGYARSSYANSITTLIYDNPIRISDSATAGPSRGTRGYWPNNTLDTIAGGGSVRLPGHSRASASLSVGSAKQNDTLQPATINPALPVVPLERSTAEAETRLIGMNYNFNSRPIRNLWLNGRYRYYDYDNRTPRFAIANMVVGDTSLGAAEESLRMAYRRHTVDLDASVTPWAFTALKAGYTREQVDHHERIFGKTAEDVFRASVDSTGNQYFTARLVYEHAVKNGEDFEPDLLAEVGEQPGMRHFDVADRSRNRVTFIMTGTPTSTFGLNASIAAGKDDYANSGFGLRDNDNRVYSIGFDLSPDDRVNVNGTYGYEKYTALQTSRTATPLSATDQSFNDPRRNWDTDSSDRVHNVAAGLGLVKVIPKSDLRLDYTYSYSKALYVYNVAPGWTLAPLRPLDPLTNRLVDFKADLLYFFQPKVALGFDYLWETYDVRDFAFEPDATGSIYPLTATGTPASAMYLNYLWRPYTGNVFSVRLRYMW